MKQESYAEVSAILAQGILDASAPEVRILLSKLIAVLMAHLEVENKPKPRFIPDDSLSK